MPREEDAQQEAAEIKKTFQAAINYRSQNLHLGFKKGEVLKIRILLGEEPNARESQSCQGLSREEKHEGDLRTGGGYEGTRQQGRELEPPPVPVFGSRKDYGASS